MANYMDNNNATEVFGAYASKINKIDPISITWANYQLLSEADKNSHRYIITDYPAQGAGQQLGTAAFKNTGVANGVADLDANGKVPASELPSYVDDIIEGYLYNGVFYTDSEHEHAITGETGKIYVDFVSDKTYRWSGSAYVEISESLALGETSSTAYAGNKGKANADNIFVIQKLIPSGASSSNKLATASDITGKADKVTPATADNLAVLNASGNLVDSGIGKDKIILLSDRTPRDITNDLSRLTTAVSEQNLEKYGYKIGDYFMGTSQINNNFRYWLADMDTFYGGYDYYAVESVHHIGIVVDTMQSSQWYTSSDITDVGYNQSTLHSYLSGSALDIIKADMIALFGGSTGLEHLLGHTKLWNKLGIWHWSDENTHSQYIAALTECQLAGAKIWSADNYQQGEGHKQLNLFVKYCFNQIFGWTWIWLRSIASSGGAVLAYDHGRVDEFDVTYSGRAAGLILFH